MKRFVFIIFMCVSLCACGNQDVEPDVIEQDLTEQAESYDVFGKDFQSIGPNCGYTSTDDWIEIHPYYNATEHIKVRKVLLSDCNFFDVVVSSVKDSAIIQENSAYQIFTLTDGTTYGVIPLEEDWCLFLKSDTLPSSYVKIACDKLCN